jgi:hypothetical protein
MEKSASTRADVFSEKGKKNSTQISIPDRKTGSDSKVFLCPAALQTYLKNSCPFFKSPGFSLIGIKLGRFGKSA